MGIFMATMARSIPQFGMLAVLILLPLQQSGVVQAVMQSVPTTHFAALGQAILFRGAGISFVLPQFLSLAAIGRVFFMLSLIRFRKTISQMV